MIRIHHVNLQPIVGGGEIYTRALTRAFVEAGAGVTLYGHPGVRLWDELPGERVELVRVRNESEFLARLPLERSIILTQSPFSVASVRWMAGKHMVAGFAHMPALGRNAVNFGVYRLVITVSQYCITLLRAAGLDNVYPEAVYGVADASRPGRGPIEAHLPYLVDPRKFRDVLLGAAAPLLELARPRRAFTRRPGLTLGIVSLIAPIKQFPEQFSILAPILARRPQVNLEIFGAGGYAQVRDLRRALAPLGRRARFWGFQEQVSAVYPQIDYLMTGLPEKEALGLNALEAQACGTPVLAPDAPPFNETVEEGTSGFRYRDPREDGGAHFAQILDAILAGRARPDPRVAAKEHLSQFSAAALTARARGLMHALSHLK